MTSNDVIAAVGTIISTNGARINQIVGLRGGWEAWLQVETALQLQAALGAGATSQREQNYPAPNAAQRADIYLHPARGADIYLELKVQNAIGDDVLVRFNADIAKIRGLDRAVIGANVIVALAYIHRPAAADLRAFVLRCPVSVNLSFFQWNAVARRWDNATAAPADNVPTLAAYKLV